MKTKRGLGVLLTMVGLFVALMPLTALADHGTLTDQGNCPVSGKVDVNSEDDVAQAEANNLVLPAGTHVCIKAGNNDGILVTADGETTLQEYLFNAGIVGGNSGQGKDVSHYTVIERPTTTVPEDTTTSVPEETTTTVPEVTTTVPEVTTTVPEVTTTVPEVTTTQPGSPSTTVGITTTSVDPELPFTGPEDNPLLLVTFGFMLAGAGLGLLAKSRGLTE